MTYFSKYKLDLDLFDHMRLCLCSFHVFILSKELSLRILNMGQIRKGEKGQFSDISTIL